MYRQHYLDLNKEQEEPSSTKLFVMATLTLVLGWGAFQTFCICLARLSH